MRGLIRQIQKIREIPRLGTKIFKRDHGGIYFEGMRFGERNEDQHEILKHMERETQYDRGIMKNLEKEIEIQKQDITILKQHITLLEQYIDLLERNYVEAEKVINLMNKDQNSDSEGDAGKILEKYYKNGQVVNNNYIKAKNFHTYVTKRIKDEKKINQ